MARFYVPLDVNYQTDHKILSAGHIAECLYVRGLAAAKRSTSEGQIRHSQLPVLALGLPGKPAKHAAKLVEVGLWDEVEGGWYIAGWLKHNMTNDDLAEQKLKYKARSQAANHKKYHVGRGVAEPECELCFPPPNKEPQSSLEGHETLLTEYELNSTELNSTEYEDERVTSSSNSRLYAVPPDEEDRVTLILNAIIERRLRAARKTDHNGYRATVAADVIAQRPNLEAMIAAGFCTDATPELAAEFFDASTYRGRTA